MSRQKNHPECGCTAGRAFFHIQPLPLSNPQGQSVWNEWMYLSSKRLNKMASGAFGPAYDCQDSDLDDKEP